MSDTMEAVTCCNMDNKYRIYNFKKGKNGLKGERGI